MHNYYVYIMSSKSRVLYVGVTNDITGRVWEHGTTNCPDSPASIESIVLYTSSGSSTWVM